MTTIRYVFRPSLFHHERTLVLDDRGLSLREGENSERRIAFTDIVSLHIEPAPAIDDETPRWLINLGLRKGRPIQIDSVYVRGTADFEHKTDEFLKVLGALHQALAPRGKAVSYSFGTRSSILIAWKIALVLCLLAGLFGVGVAIALGEFEAVFGAAAFVGLGALGLVMLRGKRGPKPYRPSDDSEPLSSA
jgi:hypothetical protein